MVSVGHSHPTVVKAIKQQAEKLIFYSNSVINDLQAQLAERLGKVCGYDDYQLFLVNSGAEANENALKLASFHTGRKRVVAFRKAFHGRTSAAVEATDNPKIVSPINDNGNVTFLPLNDIDAVCSELRKGDRIPSPDFLRVVREECDANGTVLILDEIQSGYGRTGRFFAHQHAGIRPDLITVAKGIATGFPMGGVLISPMFKPAYGQLGTTFGGNHLACATAIAVLDVMESEHLVENAVRVGQHLLDNLRKIEGIKEVRGLGLMIGIEMPYAVKELRNKLIYQEHVFTGAASTDIIRLLPPLTLTMEEADEFLMKFNRALNM